MWGSTESAQQVQSRKFPEEELAGQRFIRKGGKASRQETSMCKGSGAAVWGVGRESAREGRAAFTHWVALTSTEMGTLGPFRMSALIHTGLWTRPSAVSCCRRSKEGPTALMLLKSSLMPVGRKWA